MEESELLQGFISKQKDAAVLIKDAAAEINIISINAAIESAHAASGIKTMMEKVLDSQMTSASRMLTRLLEAKGVKLDPASLGEFANWVGIDEIYITDADGVTVGSNVEGAIGWKFPDDPKAQAYVFRKLIKSKDGVVTQPISVRDIDNAMFKFVGVSRTDEPGIVQVGYRAESITRYQTEIGSVFGILADAISSLGIKVSSIAKQIMEITNELEKQTKIRH
jgi:hypothetical protein